jgi:putative oxidoreductase
MGLPSSATPAMTWSPRLLSILRIVAAFLFLAHGTAKLFGWPHVDGAPTSSPPLLSEVGIAGIVEAGGGLLLLLGFMTRPVAFVASGEMAVAYFKVHQPQGPLPLQNHGELAALFCFIWLYVCVAGGGSWSLDAFLRRKPTGSAAYAIRY